MLLTTLSKKTWEMDAVYYCNQQFDKSFKLKSFIEIVKTFCHLTESSAWSTEYDKKNIAFTTLSGKNLGKLTKFEISNLKCKKHFAIWQENSSIMI